MTSIAWLVVIIIVVAFYLPVLKKYREYMFFANFHLEYHAKINKVILWLSALSALSGFLLLIVYKKSVFGTHVYGLFFSGKMLLLLLFLYLSFPYIKTEAIENIESIETEDENFLEENLSADERDGKKTTEQDWEQKILKEISKKTSVYILVVLAFLIVVFGLLLRFDNLY